MERHSMPRTHASHIGPTDWNEALDIIVHGSPEQSVEGMKVFCHELAQTMSDPDGSAMDDVSKDADRLVSCLNKVAKTFDLCLMGASSRSCKYVLNTLMQTFQNKRLAHAVKESTLDSLITELWLLDERVPRMDDGSRLLKALNVLKLKILDNAERTSSFVVLINLLRPLDPGRWPSPPSNESFSMRNQKFSDLVVKCLIKLTKQMMRTHENCKKVKRETQVFKKTRRNKFIKIKVGSSIKRCAAKRYKKAVESKGKVFKSSTVRPDMTGLVDHLRHVSIKLAPGGAERFQRLQSAEGQVEHRLKSADSTLVQVKKQLADKSDSLMGMKSEEDNAADSAAEVEDSSIQVSLSERSQEMIEKDGIYLAKFFELLTKENQRKWLKNLKYAVFGLHQIAEVTDQSLDMLGAKRLLKMLMNAGNFNLWQSMIWKELEEEYNGEKGCTPSRGGPHSRGRMTRPLKNHKINWLCENWWNIEAEFQWVKHRNLSYHLKKEQIQTLHNC